jgi:hypothetical protein
VNSTRRFTEHPLSRWLVAEVSTLLKSTVHRSRVFSVKTCCLRSNASRRTSPYRSRYSVSLSGVTGSTTFFFFLAFRRFLGSHCFRHTSTVSRWSKSQFRKARDSGCPTRRSKLGSTKRERKFDSHSSWGERTRITAATPGRVLANWVLRSSG